MSPAYSTASTGRLIIDDYPPTTSEQPIIIDEDLSDDQAALVVNEISEHHPTGEVLQDGNISPELDVVSIEEDPVLQDEFMDMELKTRSLIPSISAEIKAQIESAIGERERDEETNNILQLSADSNDEILVDYDINVADSSDESLLPSSSTSNGVMAEVNTRTMPDGLESSSNSSVTTATTIAAGGPKVNEILNEVHSSSYRLSADGLHRTC